MVTRLTSLAKWTEPDRDKQCCDDFVDAVSTTGAIHWYGYANGYYVLSNNYHSGRDPEETAVRFCPFCGEEVIIQQEVITAAPQ